MVEEARGSKLGDALVTIPAVWLILILAGLSGGWLQPSIGGAMVSVGVCIGLLFAWGRWTGPGRRTVLGVYLLAGLLYFILVLALVLSTHPDLIGDGISLFSAGLGIGFMPTGGPDMPGEYYFFPLLLNLFGPILAMGALRIWARGDLTA
jgi:hypothetical protein